MFNVQNGTIESDMQPMNDGAPQRSVLSGLIFILYINSITNCKPILYADDLVLYFSSESFEYIQKNLKIEIENLCKWCATHGMIINREKTKCMLLTPPRCVNKTMQLHINNEAIEQVATFKYLGIQIDAQLNFNEHYEEVCQKMSSRTHLLRRHKSSFPTQCLSIFTSSLVLSVLDYCLSIWGDPSKTKYERLDKIMVNAAKLIVKPLPKTQSSRNFNHYYLEKVNWLSSAERFEYYTIMFLFDHMEYKTSLTDDLKQYYRRSEGGMTTRNKNNYVLPRMKTEKLKSSLVYQTISCWNSLPPTLQKTKDRRFFETSIRN